MKNTPVKSIVAIAIGAALFFVCGRFVAIPCPVPNTNISIQYGVLALFGAAFGPFVALLAGFIGHALIDFSYGWGVWWSWVIASAVAGFIMGICKNHVKLATEKFDGSRIVKFNVYQIVANLLAWVVVAPVLDILMYAEPVNKVFVQGLWAAGSNIVTTAIVGTILCAAYSASKPKKDSLEKKA
ncbi:MAG: ECF-type riboflavin transporter substrate-binding protein [Firmicutes bacterium]|nr:ECF-type riboflavin transporter substrate-binding protein [Bacillota bacterium]